MRQQHAVGAIQYLAVNSFRSSSWTSASRSRAVLPCVSVKYFCRSSQGRQCLHTILLPTPRTTPYRSNHVQLRPGVSQSSLLAFNLPSQRRQKLRVRFRSFLLTTDCRIDLQNAADTAAAMHCQYRRAWSVTSLGQACRPWTPTTSPPPSGRTPPSTHSQAVTTQYGIGTRESSPFSKPPPLSQQDREHVRQQCVAPCWSRRDCG